MIQFYGCRNLHFPEIKLKAIKEQSLYEKVSLLR